MGADKAFLRVHDTTLLERAVGIAKLAADAVYICGPREKFGTEAIEDIFPDCGPLGGIHAALKSSQSELNLVLAVDLPFVEADFLKYLLGKTEINPVGGFRRGTAQPMPLGMGERSELGPLIGL